MRRDPWQLGDQLSLALRTVGITEERVAAWLGAPCHCKERQAKLNTLGAWAYRIMRGETANATTYLGALMNDSFCDTLEVAAQEATERTTCRVCGSASLVNLFSFGEQYVSDFVELGKEQEGRKAPLDLVRCDYCTCVQLRHTVPSELLYTGNYWYKSGTTQTMRDALRSLTQAIEEEVDIYDGDIVLDIGSNDGTLLRSYEAKGILRVGFEPAKNLKEEGIRGLTILMPGLWSAREYWSGLRQFLSEYPQYIKPHSTPLGLPIYNREHLKAKVITAIGMLYDLEDPVTFLKDVAECLADDGIFVAQLMCLRNMLDVGDVGNICHEHLEYYSLVALGHLLHSAGLQLYDIETVPVNGQSYRLWIHKIGHERVRGGSQERVYQAINREPNGEEIYDFYATALGNRKQVCRIVKSFTDCGKSVWIYGASTKGNSLLQWWGLDKTLITAAADRSPAKWGKVTIGTGIPIYDEKVFRAAQPDYALVLPYAFLLEFIQREAQWLINGGKFIVPLPTLRLVGKEALR